MNTKFLNIFFGLLLILASIWEFDSNSWNKIGLSAVLFLSGLSSFLTDIESEFIQKMRNILLYSALLISIFLVLKVLFLG